MAKDWDKLDKDTQPNLEALGAWVNTPLWGDLLAYMARAYQALPKMEYSGCGMMPGWNLKFRKAGRGLCTLYPDRGAFAALVVIGQREKAEMEQALPALTDYTRRLYANTEEGMGQRWLMFRVEDAAVLEDVKQCIAIRRRAG